MRPDRKTLYLLFLCLCMLIPLLYAEPPFDDGFFFIEEIFASDDVFSFGDFLMDEEASPNAEIRSGEDALFTEELFDEYDDYFFDDDFFLQYPTLIIETPKFQMRSFDAVFPGLSWEQRAMATSTVGLRNFFMKGESPMLVPNPDSGIDLLDSVREKDPSHLIEALLVVPYNGQEIDLLEIYNALGMIENIKDYSVWVNGRDYYAITESSRIVSASNRRDIPDPPPAERLPFSETMYLRIREIDFGNFFLRGDVSISLYGMTYRMTNFTDIRVLLIPIMRAERFNIIVYLEPVEEGILVYCVSGFYMPAFIVSMFNLTSSINNRVTILINWMIDSLRKQGSAATGIK